MWGHVQDESFDHVKAEITKSTVLALFNTDVKISADASSFGLWAALLQKTTSSWKSMAFASRYDHVEKEAWPSHGPVRDS